MIQETWYVILLQMIVYLPWNKQLDLPVTKKYKKLIIFILVNT
jgi:hypothetical protein